MDESLTRRAWTSATIDASAAWYFQFPEPLRAACQQKIKAHQHGDLASMRWNEGELTAHVPGLASIAVTLEEGRGFVILQGDAEGSAKELTACYWLVGQLLGEPCEQNIEGIVLYDVRNTGRDVSEGARFSVTSYESSFHTDNSFGTTVLDYVGLLCLQPARSGGVNHVVSGVRVLEILGAEFPKTLRVLRRPFHVDRRGGARGDETPTIQVPVIDDGKADIVYRYLRYWIEVGHQKAEAPLTSEQIDALDTLDEVLRRPDLRVEFRLKRGQMLFLNNRWLLHNRTAFDDFPEIERRRHLVRLWLKSRSGMIK